MTTQAAYGGGVLYATDVLLAQQVFCMFNTYYQCRRTLRDERRPPILRMGFPAIVRHYNPLHWLRPCRVDAKVFGVASSHDMARQLSECDIVPYSP
jgi:hypothetical protein